MAEPQAPKPSLDRTYKRADGEEIGTGADWVTSLDWFEDDDRPVELIEETWQRVMVRRFWHMPTALYSCEVCDEDAVAWQQSGDEWAQVCAEHRSVDTEPEEK